MRAPAERPLPWSWPRARRAPPLRKLFLQANISSCKLAISKLLRRAASSTSFISASPSSSSSSAPPASASDPAPPSYPAHTFSIHRSASLSHSPSLLVGAIAIANCLRRHSDAIAPPASFQHRFSLDGARPYFSTAHLNKAEPIIAPNINRLGSHTTRPNSLDLVSMGSPLVAKVKDTCAQLGQAAARHSSGGGGGGGLPLDLFIGNPFLTRVSPAPVSSILPNDNHLVTPSHGLLKVSTKANDLALKDRIVFFL